PAAEAGRGRSDVSFRTRLQRLPPAKIGWSLPPVECSPDRIPPQSRSTRANGATGGGWVVFITRDARDRSVASENQTSRERERPVLTNRDSSTLRVVGPTDRSLT